MNMERCICCGAEIPEGRQICPRCRDEVNRMPEFKIGRCCCCGAENVMTLFMMGYDGQGHIECGFVCSDCRKALRALREEVRKTRGGSESQERNPRKN